MIGKVNGAAITGMTLRPKTVLAVLPLTGRRDEEGKDQILQDIPAKSNTNIDVALMN